MSRRRKQPLIKGIIDEVRADWDEANEPPPIPIVQSILATLAIGTMKEDGSYSVPYSLVLKELMLRGWTQKAAEEGMELCEGLRGPFYGHTNH